MRGPKLVRKLAIGEQKKVTVSDERLSPPLANDGPGATIVVEEKSTRRSTAGHLTFLDLILLREWCDRVIADELERRL